MKNLYKLNSREGEHAFTRAGRIHSCGINEKK